MQNLEASYSVHHTQSKNTLVDEGRRWNINIHPRSHDFTAAMTNKAITATDTSPGRQITTFTTTLRKEKT